MPLVRERAKLCGNCITNRAPQCSVKSRSVPDGLREDSGATASTVNAVTTTDAMKTFGPYISLKVRQLTRPSWILMKLADHARADSTHTTRKSRSRATARRPMSLIANLSSRMRWECAKRGRPLAPETQATCCRTADGVEPGRRQVVPVHTAQDRAVPDTMYGRGGLGTAEVRWRTPMFRPAVDPAMRPGLPHRRPQLAAAAR